MRYFRPIFSLGQCCEVIALPLARSGDRSPSRFGLGILLDPHSCVSVEDKRDLSKAFSFASGNGITL